VVGIELHHAKAFRVLHRVGEDDAAFFQGRAFLQNAGEALGVEDVIAQHQAHRGGVDKVRTQQKGLGQPVRAGLRHIGEVEPQAGAVAQHVREARQVRRGGDDEDVTDASEHEGGERVVDHGFVVHRQQLLADDPRERMQPRARAARQDDALHFRRLRHARLACAFGPGPV